MRGKLTVLQGLIAYASLAIILGCAAAAAFAIWVILAGGSDPPV